MACRFLRSINKLRSGRTGAEPIWPARPATCCRRLKDRMLLLDPQSDFFRSFIGRIRVFHLPIHLEAKSAAVHPLALRGRLRHGFFRRGWHGYGRARLSRRRCHLMISFGRARTVNAALLLNHARSTEGFPQKIRPIGEAAPDAAQAPAVWAAGSSLRAAPVSWQLCARVERLLPSRGFCARTVFRRPCDASFHEK